MGLIGKAEPVKHPADQPVAACNFGVVIYCGIHGGVPIRKLMIAGIIANTFCFIQQIGGGSSVRGKNNISLRIRNAAAINGILHRIFFRFF